jgi:hypothetical protein
VQPVQKLRGADEPVFDEVLVFLVGSRREPGAVRADYLVELRGFEPPTSAGAGTRAIDRARFG